MMLHLIGSTTFEVRQCIFDVKVETENTEWRSARKFLDDVLHIDAAKNARLETPLKTLITGIFFHPKFNFVDN